MKPTLQRPTWAGTDWQIRCEQAMIKLSLLVEPAYCGNKLSELFPSDDRLFKDLALILLGSDWPSCVSYVQELVLIYSEKCECKECVFHQIEMV